jgi:hypothetical protein
MEIVEAEPDDNNKKDFNILDIIDKIAERIDPLLKLLQTYFEHTLKQEHATAKLHLKMSWIALIVVMLIVGVSGWLTYVDKIDGATFTFLLGLVVGYVLTFVRDAIRRPEE